MGLIDFVKSAGKALGIVDIDAITKEIEGHGLKGSGLDIKVNGDKVVIEGMPSKPDEREKIIAAIGNIEGIAAVEDKMDGEAKGEFYTVKSGDTLYGIANSVYGNGSKYPQIFEANKPMLEHPDRIYPGQVLVIPKD